jgi:hypothetical protein
MVGVVGAPAGVQIVKRATGEDDSWENLHYVNTYQPRGDFNPSSVFCRGYPAIYRLHQ